MVGETVGAAGLAVMGFLGLDQDHPSRRAAPAHAPAEEILNPAFGDADQPVVVAVQIIGVGGEPGVDRLHAARPIADQADAIRGRHRTGDP